MDDDDADERDRQDGRMSVDLPHDHKY